MTPVQIIYYIAFPIVFLLISGAEITRNIKNAHPDLITVGYSWQYATNDERFRKVVDQFGLSSKKNETQTFRITTHKIKKWKDLLESHIDVYVELIPSLQEQTTVNIYKYDEMNFAELYDIINMTSNSLLIIDSDSKSSDQINILLRTATKCSLCAHSADEVSPAIYFCNNVVSNNWINKLGRTCHAAMPSVPNGLRHESTVYSLMPRIFASATEHKHDRFYHGTQQPRSVHKTHQDLRNHHVLSRHRKKHRIYIRKYKLLMLHREQKAKRKTRKEAPDVLEVPIGRRKLLCKYRKSCYDTGIIPDVWNIHNIFPRFMNRQEQKNFSEKESMTEMQTEDENEEKKEISEAELKLLCRYRKSCYEKLGAEVEESAQKIHATPIFSRIINILPATERKSIKEIARMALAKAEEKEKIVASRPIPTKVIFEKDLHQIEEKMKKSLACKYRKSCYDSGVLPEIDLVFDNLFQKIYDFLRRPSHQTGIQEITHKEFTNFNDDEKKVYCKYRKSCYNSGQKPVINQSQIFKYIHIAKNEEVIPLEIRCKYRKSCYKTGILPELKKTSGKEEAQPVVPVQTVISLQHLKALCKYRKSCYKRKVEEQQNLNIGLFNEAKTFDMDESEPKKEEKREKTKITEPFQKEAVLKSEQNESSEKMKHILETKLIKEASSKKQTKKSRVIIPEEKKTVAAMENEKLEKNVHKTKKKKTKEPVQKTPIRSAKEDQKSASSATTMKQPTTEKRTPERVGSKKERLKAEEVQKSETITKEKKILVNEKDFKNGLLPTATEIPSLPAKKVESILFQTEDITPLREMNIYDKSLSPLAIKLLCKYRKSCYENGKPPLIQNEKITQDLEKDHKPLQIRCKYRKSCYKTGKLPQNLHENFQMTHLTKKKEEYDPEKQIVEEHIPLTIRCKYRKSCYETGKLPPIETNTFGFSTIQILHEYKDKQPVRKELSKEQLKLRCKYRKSCYESGILPPYLNHSVYIVTTSTKQYESPKLKCKYRKSCYESMKLDIQLDKVRKKEEQKKVQEGIAKAPHDVEPVIKHKEKEQKREVQEVTDEKDKRTRKKKSKEPKYAKEEEYMQIEPLDSQSRQTATKLRPLNITQKLKCKYRLKCYDGEPLHQVAEEKEIEKQRQLNIKDFHRANGAACNIYYISCRKQAGLPILERAPIGPNGRRLCRKKKKEEITH
uniref:Reverse transcriptase domain-containing protein n=1 Tax=Elaeophora elaphi TaxID=1147741 RepID=A0A158Q7K3_9BILA